jgi:hypothetical protein
MSSNLDALLQNAAALSLGTLAPSVSFASPIAATGAALARKEGIADVDEGTEGTGDSSTRDILSFWSMGTIVSFVSVSSGLVAHHSAFARIVR